MKNFAGQPPQGGMMEILTGRELTTDVREAEFQKMPLFIDNCKNCNNMKNADGSFFSDAFFVNFLQGK